MTIDDILLGVLDREGWPKVTDRAADRGGLTKGGVTIGALASYRGRQVSRQELRDLRQSEAIEVLRKGYVIDPGLHQIADDALRVFAVDYAVHSWHDDPIKAIQRAVGVEVDGRFGPRTRAALAKADARAVYRAVFLDRWIKLEDLVIDDPLMQAFMHGHKKAQIANLRGWMNRLRLFLPEVA